MLRKREKKLLEKAGYVQSGNSALAPIVSTIAIVSTFTCHIFLKRKLTAPVVRVTSNQATVAPYPWQAPGEKPLSISLVPGIRTPSCNIPNDARVFHWIN